jgi:isopenicillin-N epimerase
VASSTSLRSFWQLDWSVAHLNHGSFGAVPHDVQLVQESFQKRMNANPNRWFRSELPDLMTGARHITASWLGVDADDFAFVPNAGQGVITAVQSLVNHVNAQHQTAHIVDTSLGYGGVTRGLQHIATRSGATYSDALLTYPIDLDASVIASRLRECMPMLGAPTIVVLDHITSETGLLLPVSEVITDLRTTHPDTMFVIDGAHSAGMLPNPIPQGCDVWVGNLHKWLCAPRPAAGLVCRNPRLRASLSPLAPSWGFEDGFPTSFDWQGTADYSAYLSVPAAITFQEQWSWSVRDEHNRRVVDGGAEFLRRAWKAEQHIDSSREAPWMRMVKTPASRPLTKAEVDATIERAGRELKAECVLVSVGDSTYVRLSAHMYNEVEDYRALVDLTRLLP